jgi:hypothetical protein
VEDPRDVHLPARAHQSWANTEDRSARSAPGRAAGLAAIDRQLATKHNIADDAPDREVRLAHALKAYFIELQAKSVAPRRAKAKRSKSSRSETTS